MKDWEKNLVKVFDGDPYNQGEFIGTAFFVSPTQLITAKHVVDDCDWNLIRLNDGPWSGGGVLALKEKPQFHPKKKDIALLNITRPVEDFKPIPMITVDLKKGDQVDLAGYSSPSGQLEKIGLVISSYEGVYDLDVANTSIAKGMSGGPVIMNDRLVGVICARDRDRNRCYIVPLSAFKDFLKEHVQFPEDDEKYVDFKKLLPLIDNYPQTKKVMDLLEKKPRKSAFIVLGECKDLPHTVANRLVYLLRDATPDPPIKLLWEPEKMLSDKEAGDLLCHLVNESLKLQQSDASLEAIQRLLEERKSIVFTLHIFPGAATIKPSLIYEIIEYWENTIVQRITKKHVLLIIVEIDSEKKQSTIWSRICRKIKHSDLDPLVKALQDKEFGERQLPDFDTIKESHLKRWKEYLPPNLCLNLDCSEDYPFKNKSEMSQSEIQRKIFRILVTPANN